MRTVWIGTAALGLLGAIGIPWFLWKDRGNREAFEIGQHHLAAYRFVADDPEREYDPMNHTGRPRETWEGRMRVSHGGGWSVWLGATSGENSTREFVYRHGSVVRFVDSMIRLQALDESGTLVMDAEITRGDGGLQLGSTGHVRDADGRWVSFHRRPWWSE